MFAALLFIPGHCFQGGGLFFALTSLNMLASIRFGTVLVAVVVLNLIGLTIAAYFVLRKK
jgi:hypothetical protein